MKLIWDCVRRHPRMFAASLLFLALEAAADLFQPGFMALIALMVFVMFNDISHFF